MNDSKLLNLWVTSWGSYSLDAVRKFISKNPALKALGQRHGPVRVYTPSEAEQIRAAFDSRKSGRRELQPAAVA